MRTRQGFVSNSSSSSFILDLRKEGMDKLVKDFSGLDKPEGLDRCTAFASGKDAIEYARAGIVDTTWWGEYEWDLGKWILEWANTLGEENLVFARESDEGMGGEFPYPIPQSLIVAEMEYH